MSTTSSTVMQAPRYHEENRASAQEITSLTAQSSSMLGGFGLEFMTRNKKRLGLEYRVESEEDVGTTFKIYAPRRFVGRESA